MIGGRKEGWGEGLIGGRKDRRKEGKKDGREEGKKDGREEGLIGERKER